MSSGVKRVAAPPAPGGGGGGVGQAKKSAPDTNGSGPAPLTYSSGEPTDDVNMNEVDDKVTLEVFLPSGKSSTITVDSNIPMLDLLVHLAAKSKVSPSGHVLQVLDEETGKAVEFKANQTIGSLDATVVHIVPKNKKPEWSKVNNANKAAKAFEITNRFTINLPGGQKAVMRVSPQLTLQQVFARVCQDKSLDSRRYTLQHPADPLAPLDLKATIADSRLAEINLIHAGASTASAESSRSMPDLHRGTASAPTSQDPASWYMPSAGEHKKKKGFLSFLKKDKKFKPQDSHHETSSTASHQVGSAVQARRPTTPPPERRSSDVNAPAARPKTMYVAPSSLEDSATPRDNGDVRPPAKALGKKRPAPKPPQAATQPSQRESAQGAEESASAASAAGEGVSSASGGSVAVSAKSAVSASSSGGGLTNQSAGAVSGLSRLHSRNSSDSSGYHELTLSGAESPEAARVPTTFKTSIDTTSIESCDNLNGDSGIQEISSPTAAESSSRLAASSPSAVGSAAAVAKGQSPQTLSVNAKGGQIKPLPSTKKKKAPPPPPKAKPAPVAEEPGETASSQSDLPPQTMMTSIPQAEDPPPPLTVEVEVTDMADLHTVVEEHSAPREEHESDSESGGEPFNLEEILEAVTFEEEPLRSGYKKERGILELEGQEVDGQEMAMMETASVVSEEAQIMEDVRSRPCEFIPPPPPDEPPPPDDADAVEAAREYADKGTVVGDDNASLAPSSLKSSPVMMHKRCDSRASVSSFESVDTVQGLSLAFEQTIALGQETLESEQWLEEEGSGYSTEMARFVAEMSRMAASPTGNDPATSSNNTSISLPDTESSETGSVIRYGDPYHVREDSRDSQSSLSSLGRPADLAVVAPEDRYATDADPTPAPTPAAFAMTEEIQAPMETVPPPLEFQNKGGEEAEEEEEEEFTSVTEEYIIPVGPGGLDYSAAVKVSEVSEKSQGVQEKDKEPSLGVFRAEPVSIRHRVEPEAASPREEKKEEQKPPAPAAKEEFVLTVEDLSSVSLVPLRPKVYAPPPQPKPARSPSPIQLQRDPEPEVAMEPAVNGSPDRSHIHLAYVSSHGHVQPVSKDMNERFSDSGPQLQMGRSRANGEDPSGTGLQLPSMRYLSNAEPLAFSDDDRSSESSNDHLYRSSAKLTMASNNNPVADDMSDDSWSRHADSGSRRLSDASSVNSQVSGPAPSRQAVGGGGDVEALQQQYATLQDQFVLWQTQLQQNQALLAAQSGGGGVEGGDAAFKALQVQVQMQQQMMEQLQMSMQALGLQQPLGVGVGPVTSSAAPPPSSTAAPASTPDPPPPPPVVAAPKVTKAEAAKPKKSKSSRFEPQLDPREELMISIRSFGGRGGLNTVPVKSTRWVYSNN